MGGSARSYFTEPILGIDVTSVFVKDYAILALKTGADPEHCLVLDTDEASLTRASAAGMQTALICGEADLYGLLTALPDR